MIRPLGTAPPEPPLGSVGDAMRCEGAVPLPIELRDELRVIGEGRHERRLAQTAGFAAPCHHRTEAVRKIGGRAIIALVLPDRAVAYKILALNTEKAHNVREKALEVVRMARSLAGIEPRPERDYALEFEEPPLLTLGLCYEQRGRFSGGAYHALLKRIDAFLDDPLQQALEIRAARAAKLFELDDAVTAAIEALRAMGLESPYLRAFVVARINPLRFQRSVDAPYEVTIDKMLAAAKAFDAASVRPDHLAKVAGPPPEE